MAKKIFRIFIILVCLICVTFALVVIVFRAVFPEERINKMTVNAIRGYLSREASIGKISLGAFSGFELSDFSLSEKPDFKAGTFLSAKDLSLQIKWFPLMKRRVIVSSFELKSPMISIVFERGGDFNFSGLLRNGSSEDIKRIAPFFLLISNLNITNGTVFLNDKRSSRHDIVLNNIDVASDNISLISPFNIDLSGEVFAGSNKFRVKSKGEINLKDRVLNITATEIKIRGAVLNISGSINDFHSNPSVDLEISGDRAVLDDFIGLFPSIANLQIGDDADINLTLKGDLKHLKVKINRVN